MKKLLPLILMLAVSAASFAQVKTDGGKTVVENKVEFDKIVHDFGDIMISDGPQSCSFSVKNVSSQPIAINNVISSCGCTDVKWTREPIRQGKAGSITATYDNTQGPYPFDKTLTVYIAGLKKPVILRLRGSVHDKKQSLSELFPEHLGALGLKSRAIKLGNLDQESQRGDAVNVANLGGTPMKVSFTNVSPGLEISVSPNPVPAGSTARMTYVVTADRSRWGNNVYYATPVVNGTARAKIEITAFTKENFTSLSEAEKAKGAQPMFESSTFNFGKVKAGTKVDASFVMTNKGKSTFEAYKIDSDTPAAKVDGTFPTVAPGGKATLKVALDTSSLPKGETLIILTLTTNSPLRPIVNLFLSGVIE
ncbi:MAG: DUF1573 domain-containing protein [Bacteroidales bacterium]|nr:DUF1573 domain-containing protein [Bacteroidales bacterium]